MLKNSLLFRLVLGIIGGILIGMSNVEFIVRMLSTFNSLFGSFLSFIIPLLILAFVTYGIAELGSGSKKILGMTVGIAYTSTILVGLFVFSVDYAVFPFLFSGNNAGDVFNVTNDVSPYMTLAMPPLMQVMTALILSFMLGIGISSSKGTALKSGFAEFHDIIAATIKSVIIPLLPFYIAGVFAKMTYAGQVGAVLSTFVKVYVLVISMQIFILIVQYTVAGAVAKKNPFVLLKNMLPAYFTAVGMQSSAASIPVTTECIKKNGVRPQVAEFVAPLCANIHMSGSATAMIGCALVVMLFSGAPIVVADMIGFIFLLGIMIIASPGVPGGTVMASIGILQANLGFDESMTALMITLFLTQDSFGTACNVTGDGAIAVIVDTFTKD